MPDKALTLMNSSGRMVAHLRRSFLRDAAVGLGVLSAGCSSLPNNSAMPDKDERVKKKPPGSQKLDPSGAWPSDRFDAGNTGANPAGTGLRDGKQYWRLNAGAAATVANGTLYNTFSRNQDHTTLTYRDPSTAAVKTSSRLVEYGVNPPPVVANGHVYVTTFIEVFCFDAKTGEQLWRGPKMDGIQSRPTVSDGTVLVNSGGFDDVRPHLRAFDAASGEELWRYDTGHASKSTPAVGDDRVFIISEGGLHAIDLETGKEAFVLPDETARWATPVVHEGSIYAVVSASDQNEHIRDELVAISTSDGTIRWRAGTEATIDTNSPSVVAAEMYTRTPDEILALDLGNGDVIATKEIHARPLGLVGDVLYAAGDGTVFALDVTNELEVLWSHTTEEVQIQDTVGQRVYHVTPIDGAVYVSARDGFHGIGPT